MINSNISRKFGKLAPQVHVVCRRTASGKVREGFGSFHSEDIETLVRRSFSEYKAPEILREIRERTAIRTPVVRASDFGNKLKGGNLFHIDKNWTFINHGAFGGALVPLQDEANAWSVLCEQQPLKFFDRHLLPMVAHSLRSLSELLRCPAEELMPLPNVTSGLNAVLSSVPISPGDEVVCLSLTYGSTKKMLKQVCAAKKGVYREVHIPLPVQSEEDIINRTAKLLNGKTKLVVIDQITSNTAVCLPLAKLSKLIRDQSSNAVILVDAAHSIFAQDISIYPQSNSKEGLFIKDVADFWISNCHKWLSTSKGAAVMWISPEVRHIVRPAIITHGFDASPLRSDQRFVNSADISMGQFANPNRVLSAFSWDGCRNYSAFLTIPSALQFWSSITEPNDLHGSLSICRMFMNNMINDVREEMIKEWGLNRDDLNSKELTKDLPLTLVPLPSIVNGESTVGVTDAKAFALQEYLHHEHNIEVPIKCLEGRLYVRISAHIYNEMHEYKKLISAIKNVHF